MTSLQADSTDFLANFVLSTFDPDVTRRRPIIACAAACNAAKADRTDVNACNIFMLKDGTCHLGYADPLLITENAGTGQDIIYSDVAV